MSDVCWIVTPYGATWPLKPSSGFTSGQLGALYCARTFCADFNGRGIPPWGLKQWEGVRLVVVREVSHELRFLVAVINEAKP